MSMSARAANRIEMALLKALVKNVKDGGELQLVKIEGLAGEVQDDVERVQPYGLTSAPPSDSEAVVAYLNGNRDHGVVIACDSGAYRLTGLSGGEVAMYSRFGQKVLLRADRVLELEGPSGIELNGAEDYAVAYTDLLTAFEELKADVNALVLAFNAHAGHNPALSGVPVTPAVPSSADMSAAKVDTVKLP